jgi:hypothetical protein
MLRATHHLTPPLPHFHPLTCLRQAGKTMTSLDRTAFCSSLEGYSMGDFGQSRATTLGYRSCQGNI